MPELSKEGKANLKKQFTSNDKINKAIESISKDEKFKTETIDYYISIYETSGLNMPFDFYLNESYIVNLKNIVKNDIDQNKKVNLEDAKQKSDALYKSFCEEYIKYCKSNNIKGLSGFEIKKNGGYSDNELKGYLENKLGLTIDDESDIEKINERESINAELSTDNINSINSDSENIGQNEETIEETVVENEKEVIEENEINPADDATILDDSNNYKVFNNSLDEYLKKNQLKEIEDETLKNDKDFQKSIFLGVLKEKCKENLSSIGEKSSLKDIINSTNEEYKEILNNKFKGSNFTNFDTKTLNKDDLVNVLANLTGDKIAIIDYNGEVHFLTIDNKENTELNDFYNNYAKEEKESLNKEENSNIPEKIDFNENLNKTFKDLENDTGFSSIDKTMFERELGNILPKKEERNNLSKEDLNKKIAMNYRDFYLKNLNQLAAHRESVKKTKPVNGVGKTFKDFSKFMRSIDKELKNQGIIDKNFDLFTRDGVTPDNVASILEYNIKDQNKREATDIKNIFNNMTKEQDGRSTKLFNNQIDKLNRETGSQFSTKNTIGYFKDAFDKMNGNEYDKQNDIVKKDGVYKKFLDEAFNKMFENTSKIGGDLLNIHKNFDDYTKSLENALKEKGIIDENYKHELNGGLDINKKLDEKYKELENNRNSENLERSFKSDKLSKAFVTKKGNIMSKQADLVEPPGKNGYDLNKNIPLRNAISMLSSVTREDNKRMGVSQFFTWPKSIAASRAKRNAINKLAKKGYDVSRINDLINNYNESQYKKSEETDSLSSTELKEKSKEDLNNKKNQIEVIKNLINREKEKQKTSKEENKNLNKNVNTYNKESTNNLQKKLSSDININPLIGNNVNQLTPPAKSVTINNMVNLQANP